MVVIWRLVQQSDIRSILMLSNMYVSLTLVLCCQSGGWSLIINYMINANYNSYEILVQYSYYQIWTGANGSLTLVYDTAFDGRLLLYNYRINKIFLIPEKMIWWLVQQSDVSSILVLSNMYVSLMLVLPRSGIVSLILLSNRQGKEMISKLTFLSKTFYPYKSKLTFCFSPWRESRF